MNNFTMTVVQVQMLGSCFEYSIIWTFHEFNFVEKILNIAVYFTRYNYMMIIIIKEYG